MHEVWQHGAHTGAPHLRAAAEAAHMNQDRTADYGKGAAGPIPQSEPYPVRGMMLSRKRWDRLKKEAEEAKMGWTELWLGAAFAFVGFAGAGLLALQTLPHARAAHVVGERLGDQLSTTTRGELWMLVAAATVIGIVCILAWLRFRDAHNASLDSLIANMRSQEHDEDELGGPETNGEST
jgi:hypothetical protein